jgi:hypothetical protein
MTGGADVKQRLSVAVAVFFPIARLGHTFLGRLTDKNGLSEQKSNNTPKYLDQ